MRLRPPNSLIRIERMGLMLTDEKSAAIYPLESAKSLFFFLQLQSSAAVSAAFRGIRVPQQIQAGDPPRDVEPRSNPFPATPSGLSWIRGTIPAGAKTCRGRVRSQSNKSGQRVTFKNNGAFSEARFRPDSARQTSRRSSQKQQFRRLFIS